MKKPKSSTKICVTKHTKTFQKFNNNNSNKNKVYDRIKRVVTSESSCYSSIEKLVGLPRLLSNLLWHIKALPPASFGMKHRLFLTGKNINCKCRFYQKTQYENTLSEPTRDVNVKWSVLGLHKQRLHASHSSLNSQLLGHSNQWRYDSLNLRTK